MFMFVILYFGIMIDSGLFDFVISKILKFVKGDFLKIVVGMVILIIIVFLDGDGIIIYMIIVFVMYLLYKCFGMNFFILVGVVMLGVGVINFIFWGGFIVCVMSVFGFEVFELFIFFILGMIVGVIWVVFVVYYFGKKERKCLGIMDV